MAAYVEGEWVAGDSYDLQNEPGTTLVFPEIEGVLQVAEAKLFIMNRTPSHYVSYALKTVSLASYSPPVAVSLGRLSS